jgi:hypothetical protein
MTDTDQPFIDCWPTALYDDALGKIPIGFDIAHAREKLARKFNRRPVRLPKLIEVERAWEQHRRRMIQCRR